MKLQLYKALNYLKEKSIFALDFLNKKLHNLTNYTIDTSIELYERIPCHYKLATRNKISNFTKYLNRHITYDLSMASRQHLFFWKGKVIGGLLGLVAFGIWGLIIGVIIGHFFDLASYKNDFNRFNLEQEEDAFSFALFQNDVFYSTFIRSVTALCAKVCASDKEILDIEKKKFKELFPACVFSDRINQIFKHAQQPSPSYEVYAYELKNLLGNKSPLYPTIIKNLFIIAGADGKIKKSEFTMIKNISDILGITSGVFNRIAKEYAETLIPQNEPKTISNTVESDYEVLGISKHATTSQIRKAWLAKIATNHPDKLIAKGATKEQIHQATKTVARINIAYERIISDIKTDKT